MNTANYLNYWGKSAAGPSGEWHPLAWHCLDVAAVVAVVLDGDALLLCRIADLAHLDRQTVRAWLPLVAALHDLGKFSRGFQHLVPALRDRLAGEPWPTGQDRPAYKPRHDAVGLAIWRHDKLNLAAELDVREGGFRIDSAKTRRLLEPWIAAATGHHGRPALATCDLPTMLSPEDRTAVSSWLGEVVRLLQPGPLAWPPGVGGDLLRPSSWLVAGLITLADWLGSSPEYFPYCSQGQTATEYWALAMVRARLAVAHAGILPNLPQPALEIAGLARIGQPTPLQSATATRQLREGPQLHVIEDLTGSGKTEAAVLLAHRLIRQGLGHGIYFALPTMATANGMHARATIWKDALFHGGPADFVLAHGQAERSAHVDRDDVPAGQMRQSWLADSRKKSLLAQLGIGTVDQVLLGILRVKHSTLRQIGVARNILIIDEVHAFDRYTGKLIEALVELQAMHGGSTIVLSATLTHSLRQQLISAFWRGRQAAKLPEVFDEFAFGAQSTRADESAPVASRSEYPLWTQVTASGLDEVPVPTSISGNRTIPVRFIHDKLEVVDVLRVSALAGRCAVWIRNTVGDAQESLLALRAAGVNARIFHARMMAGHRAIVEADVLADFGKASGAERRGKVLVATQVVEQSLDLDFDVMVTDLAPADLLIQRAGRLHRHRRDSAGLARVDGDCNPDGRESPELLVLAPSWADEPKSDWLQSFLPGTQAVYRDPALLWRTQKVILERGAIILPKDARHLVEYANADEPVPPALDARANQADGEGKAKSAVAQLNKIHPSSGYFSVDALAHWHDDTEMPTRLGQPTQRLRLAIIDGNQLVPLCTSWLRNASWFDADVQVPAGRVTPPTDMELQLIDLTNEQMPDKGRWTSTVVLAQTAQGTWKGRGIEYNLETGLHFAGRKA